MRHPKCLLKLKSDIQEIIGSKTNVTRNELKSIKYLQNVLNESRYCFGRPHMVLTSQRYGFIHLSQ
jgi:hypothetical protein